MSQYLLLKSNGEPNDPSVGLTSDSQGEGGVLGGDNYEAAATSHNGYLELSADSEYVAIDSFLQSSTITGMTVMAWVRSTDSSGEDYISSHDRSEYYRFNLNDGEFDCSFDTSGGGGDHNSGVFVADGEWHHLAAVYDAGTVRMYVDGRRVYTDTGYATEIGSGGTRYGFLGAGSEAESFDGGTNANAGVHDISDHRLYLDAKTDAEVEAAFEGNPPTTGLHEYLPLTADDAGRLNDASGNGRHGYLRNGASVRNSGQFTSWYRFEDAEDADFSDWTVNEGSLTADSDQAIGTYSMFHDGMAGVDSGETNDPRGAVKALGETEQISGFTFTYWETSSNTSAALSFYNSDGQREFSVGTDNPAWAYDDASGNDTFGNPREYQDWMQFTITFNWSQSQYTVEGKDLQTGYTASHTGDLYHGTDIAEVASGQVGLFEYTGGGQWHLDQMFVETTNEQTTPLSESSTFDTTNTTSSSLVGQTQASSLLDQQGGGFSEVGSEFMESGEVTLSTTIDGGEEVSVSFSNDYNNPVVVAYLMTEGGGQDIQVRVKDLTENGCTIFSKEPDNEEHNPENVGYIVCERGTHRLQDGRVIQAGTKSTDFLYPNDGADSETFYQSFSTKPVVLHLLNSYNSQEFRFSGVDNVTTGGFDVFQDDVTTDSSHTAEDIGWIALEPGYYGSLSGNAFEVGTTGAFTETFFNAHFSVAPDLVCATQTRDGGSWASGDGVYNADSFITENNTGSSNNIGFLVLESDSIVNEQTGSDEIAAYSEQQSTVTSTTLSDALREAFTSTTFANSSSDTTVGGLTELFTHADQPADIATSSVVEAFTESFDTVQRTALGDAFSTVTGDTTVATATGSSSLANTVAKPLVAAQAASTITQSADQSFGEAYAGALDASTFTTETTATFSDSAVTALGQIDSAQFDGLTSGTSVEIIAVASRPSVDTIENVATGSSDTTAVALTPNVIAVPISPTLDIVLNVEATGVGIEGSFADSLSASVGAQTSIKVSKTVTNAEEQTGDGTTSSTSVGIDAAADTTASGGVAATTTTLNAIRQLASLSTFGTSSTDSTASGGSGAAAATTFHGDGFSSATVSAAVRDTVAFELDASASTQVTAEALSAAAETLVEQGIADTQVEAAALVSTALADDSITSEFTSSTTQGETEIFDTTDRTGRSMSFTVSEAMRQTFDTDVVDVAPLAEALPLISATLVSAMNMSAEGTSSATADGATQTLSAETLLALLRILYPSLTGDNYAVVQNERNYVDIEQ